MNSTLKQMTAQLEAKTAELQSAFNQGILRKMRVEQRKKAIPWIESLDLTSANKIQLVSSNIDDDIQRELLFYNLTIENTKGGLHRLKAENVKLVRPVDYFAEMYKSDDVMQRIKSNLVRQQVKIQNFEEKKQRRDNKKFSKKLQKQKELDKVKEKKRNLDSINKWKEEIKTKGDFAPDLDEFIQQKDKDYFKGRKGHRQNEGKRDGNRGGFRGGVQRGGFRGGAQRGGFRGGAKQGGFREGAKQGGFREGAKKGSFGQKSQVNGKSPHSKKIKKSSQRPGKVKRTQMRSKKNSKR